ncbi:MAG TPA: T9SS type A sorting domain-containing protein [Flavobacteriales bacterium]
MQRTLLSTLVALSLLQATAQTPTLVRDFHPGSIGAYVMHGYPNGFREHNGKLLIFANEDMASVKLFALDGIDGPVQELAAVGNVAGYTTTNGGIITSGDNIYFFAQQSASTNFLLWCVRPGQAAEQLAVLPYSILFGYTGIPLSGGRLLFPGHDADHGFELWITDGTSAGTHRLKDINPGTPTSFGSPFPVMQGFDFQGNAYFLANDGTNGPQLWTSDGTEAGTQQFATINSTGATGAITLLWGKNADRFVVSSNSGLLGSDGTTGGTSLIHAGEYTLAHIPGLNYHTADNGYLYFSALESGDWKLYRTQGTSASTQLVMEDVVPNQGFPYLTELGGMLYALTNDGDQNTVLVRMDPIAQEHTIVKTFTSTQGPNGTANFYGFRNDGQHFYFMGRDGDHAKQYWKSDGTEAGTAMVHEFLPSIVNGGPDAANGNMIVYDGHFVFSANDASVGVELWATEAAVGLAEVQRPGAEARVWGDGSRNLVVQALEGEVIAVKVMDATGKTVLERGGLRAAHIIVPAQGLGSGVYIVQVTTTKGVGVNRVVLD